MEPVLGRQYFTCDSQQRQWQASVLWAWQETAINNEVRPNLGDAKNPLTASIISMNKANLKVELKTGVPF